MATRKSTTKKTSPANEESTNIGRIFDENVKLLARSAEVALKAYVEIVKSLTDQRMTNTSARLIEQIAEGWKDALIESTRLLRNAYSSLDRQIKPAPVVHRRASNRRGAR